MLSLYWTCFEYHVNMGSEVRVIYFWYIFPVEKNLPQSLMARQSIPEVCNPH
jgi:hypothetical protein